MSLTLRMLSEHDVAKVVDALVECAEARRAEGDETAERILIRLSERIADALDEAVPGPGFAARVEASRAQWAAHVQERAARRRKLRQAGG